MALFELASFEYDLLAAYGAAFAAGTRLPLKARPDTASLMNVVHEQDELRQGLYFDPPIVGRKSDSGLDIEYWAHGWSSTKPIAGPAAPHPDAELCAHALGNHRVFGANAFTTCSGIDVTKKILTVAASLNYAIGDAIAVQTAEGWETGVIANITGPAPVTLVLESPLLSAVQGVDTAVYAGVTCYWTKAAQLDALAAQVKGDEAWDLVEARGCTSRSYKMTLSGKEFASISQGFHVADWIRAGAGGPATYAAYAYPAREELIGGMVRAETGGTVTEFSFSTADLDLGMELSITADPTTNGVQGIARPIVAAMQPIITVNPLSVSDAWRTAFAASTEYNLSIQWGTQPGKIILIQVPRAVLVKTPAAVDRDKRHAELLTFRPHYYDGDTGSLKSDVTSAGDKDLRVAWL